MPSHVIISVHCSHVTACSLSDHVIISVCISHVRKRNFFHLLYVQCGVLFCTMNSAIHNVFSSAPRRAWCILCFFLLQEQCDAFFLLHSCDVFCVCVCVNSVMCFIYSMNGVMCSLCSRYGPVVSVRMLPEKYCAFINFKLKESAGRAMQCLQVRSCCFIMCVCVVGGMGGLCLSLCINKYAYPMHWMSDLCTTCSGMVSLKCNGTLQYILHYWSLCQLHYCVSVNDA